MLNRKVKPIAVLIGTTFVASLTAAGAASADELFVTAELDQGYDLLAQADAEGKCGEGKCGEGKCGEGEGDAEGEDKDGEGKCGGAA
ncbi:MAG: low-complexity protein [Gammaproteobacteria bacterium]|nr:low-complexity protein [Gammaproteobacteria bacterium]